MSGDEKPEDCDGCHFNTSELTLYEDRPGIVPKGREKRWLCALCASTPCGNAATFPNQYPDAKVLQTICYVGNVILAALRRDKEA